MRDRIGQLRAAGEAERRAVEVSSAAARRATYHLVQPGEALELIARRYGTTTDSLLAWNALGAPRIVAGQRLLVRPGQAP
ncbi:MAG: LysM peptidoglycan-binding domain-containing protein [Gemmatimonadetes bacterium]|nr:LysM peptidoglycan-binding domain-containing protein [Gemmatimonadota bacterium]